MSMTTAQIIAEGTSFEVIEMEINDWNKSINKYKDLMEEAMSKEDLWKKAKKIKEQNMQ